MSQVNRYARNQTKASRRRRLNAQQRLERDRRQAQQAAEALLHSQQSCEKPVRVFDEYCT
jgi:hypothetical protein